MATVFSPMATVFSPTATVSSPKTSAILANDNRVLTNGNQRLKSERAMDHVPDKVRPPKMNKAVYHQRYTASLKKRN